MSSAPEPPGARPPAQPVPPDFRLEGRLVQPGLNRITSGSRTIQLEPKIMQVLQLLAGCPGAVVTRERLFQDVWDGAYVTEDVLTRAVGELRRIFEDDPAKPRVIETIRKTGYRLLSAPQVVEPAPRPLPAAAPGEEAPRLSPPSSRGRLGAAAVASVVVAAVAFGFLLWRGVLSPRRVSPPMRIRLLTSAVGNERDPAVSPDGTRVAFAWNGGAGEAMSLYVQLVDSDRPLRLTSSVHGEDRGPAWSGDGTRIAFSRMADMTCRIVVVPALGGAERELGPCGDPEFHRLAWSPDGAWIALVRREGTAPARIELLSPETLERRAVTRPPAGIVGDSSPAFAPDGRSLVFARNLTGGVSDLYRVGTSGGDPTRLTFDDRDTMGADWSPDGKSIVFSSSRAGMYSLWRVPARGGEPGWVAGGGMKMKHPSTSRSRDLIAYENWLYQVDLWRVPLRGGGAPAAVSPSTDEWSFQPDVSEDGGLVAFVSTRSGEQDVWVAGASGADARRVTSLSNARVETPRFSRDRRRIVFSARQGGRSDLWLVDAAGGVARKITSGPGDAVAPAWSRDGRSVYYGSRALAGTWAVRRLTIADGRSVEVAPAGYAARESRDGKTLFFTRAGESGLWSQPAEGGPATRVLPDLPPEDWADWDVARDGIYFRETCREHPEPRLAFLAFGGTKPEHVASLPDPGWSGLSVSADGRFAIYSRVDRHACDIRLIENAR